ncbi:MAG: c-type cytochrome [Balneolales bacterium]|nr:c-type cytochrome [Balneolales bacterium]
MKILDDEKDLLMDHEYDGIKELDNHMPRWWLYLFYFTIGWGFLYLVNYTFTGVGMDQHEQYQAQLADAAEKYGFAPEGDEEIAATAIEWEFETDAASIENGKTIYMGTGNLCFTCHGGNGEGLVGPNLTDTKWLHGCSPSEMATSIATGFPDKGMIAYGSGARISDEDMTDLISYLATLVGTEPANAKAADETRAVDCSF